MRTSNKTRDFAFRVGEACFWLIVAGAVLSAGCERGAASLPLDKTRAKQELIQFLDSWKAGTSIGDYRTAHPQAVASDFEWEGGVQLAGYSILGEQDDGTNLHVKVELMLRTPQGEAKQPMVYVVGTSPQVSIFRKF